MSIILVYVEMRGRFMKTISEEIRDSYYEYVMKIEDGCLIITDLLRKGKYTKAFETIISFAEGIQWLLVVEETMRKESYVINSRINEANDYLMQINESFEMEDFVTVADIFEYEIAPIFSSATEWVFELEVEN